MPSNSTNSLFYLSEMEGTEFHNLGHRYWRARIIKRTNKLITYALSGSGACSGPTNGTTVIITAVVELWFKGSLFFSINLGIEFWIYSRIRVVLSRGSCCDLNRILGTFGWGILRWARSRGCTQLRRIEHLRPTGTMMRTLLAHGAVTHSPP